MRLVFTLGIKQLIGLSLVSVLGWGELPVAAAQTGRIAHYSHGGSVATVAAASDADNFGYPVMEVVEVIERTSDSTAVLRGYITQGVANDHRSFTEEVLFLNRAKRRVAPGTSYLPAGGKVVESPAELRKEYPQATFLGFDKFKARKSAPKKSTDHSQIFPKRPFQYSYWRALTSVAALGAIGWLLGKKRVA